ncbi:hypothetical protein ACFL20_13765 [Spirochaetota bacterium]
MPNKRFVYFICTLIFAVQFTSCGTMLNDWIGSGELRDVKW